MDTTLKLPCTCESPFQDERYGVGIRLHNVGKLAGTIHKESARAESARCSVCGAIKKLK